MRKEVAIPLKLTPSDRFKLTPQFKLTNITPNPIIVDSTVDFIEMKMGGQSFPESRGLWLRNFHLEKSSIIS